MQDLSAVYKAVNKVVEPAVVEIQTTRVVQVSNPFRGRNYQNQLRQFFPDADGDGQPDLPPGLDQFDQSPDQREQRQGTGSGVIMETDGNTAYIITNNHVVQNATGMTITLWDDRKIKNGKVVGTDPKSDLAVVKFEADRIIPAKWGDSDLVEKGDIVMAFGAPFGYVGSMTHGIVSALNRAPGIIRGNYRYENFIQVDAPINPGNSGGPLANLKGEVIGINTAIATESGGFMGLGFAIPSNQAKFIYDAIKSKGRVVRGWLGVSIDDVTTDPARMQSLGYTGTKGAFIAGVMGNGPAAGKLMPNDIIIAVNGNAIDDSQELRTTIASIPPDSDARMDVFRDGEKTQVTVKLREQPDDLRAVANAPEVGGRGDGRLDANTLGIRVSEANSELLQRQGLPTDVKGVVVGAVRSNSMAERAGLRAGDVITRIDTMPITSVDDLTVALAKADVAKGMHVHVTDADGVRSVFVRRSQD
jgi:serine protease Do